LVRCNTKFGTNACWGLDGVFGQDFTNVEYENKGLWKLWLWLPEDWAAGLVGYQLERGDHISVQVSELDS